MDIFSYLKSSKPTLQESAPVPSPPQHQPLQQQQTHNRRPLLRSETDAQAPWQQAAAGDGSRSSTDNQVQLRNSGAAKPRPASESAVQPLRRAVSSLIDYSRRPVFTSFSNRQVAVMENSCIRLGLSGGTGVAATTAGQGGASSSVAVMAASIAASASGGIGTTPLNFLHADDGFALPPPPIHLDRIRRMTSRDRSFLRQPNSPALATGDCESSSALTDGLSGEHILANGCGSSTKQFDEVSELRKSIEQMRNHRAQSQQQQQQQQQKPGSETQQLPTAATKISARDAVGPVVGVSDSLQQQQTKAISRFTSPAMSSGNSTQPVPTSGTKTSEYKENSAPSSTAKASKDLLSNAIEEAQIKRVMPSQVSQSFPATKTSPEKQETPLATKTTDVGRSSSAVSGVGSQIKSEAKTITVTPSSTSVKPESKTNDGSAVDSLIENLSFASVEVALTKFSSISDVEIAFKEEENRLADALNVAGSFQERQKLRKAIREGKQIKQEVVKLLTAKTGTAPAVQENKPSASATSGVRRYTSTPTAAKDATRITSDRGALDGNETSASTGVRGENSATDGNNMSKAPAQTVAEQSVRSSNNESKVNNGISTEQKAPTEVPKPSVPSGTTGAIKAVQPSPTTGGVTASLEAKSTITPAVSKPAEKPAERQPTEEQRRSVDLGRRGSRPQAPSQLQVEDLPLIPDKQPRSLTLSVGELFAIEFRIKRGLTRRSVKVCRSDGSPVNASQFRLSVIGDLLKIEKRQIEMGDIGEYIVEIEDASKAETVRFSIRLPEHSSISVVQAPSDILVPEGGQIQLEGSVTGLCDKCTVLWQCPLQQYRYKSQVDRKPSGDTKVTLVAARARKGDDGEYKLVIRHDAEECQCSARVTITDRATSSNAAAPTSSGNSSQPQPPASGGSGSSSGGSGSLGGRWTRRASEQPPSDNSNSAPTNSSSTVQQQHSSTAPSVSSSSTAPTSPPRSLPTLKEELVVSTQTEADSQHHQKDSPHHQDDSHHHGTDSHHHGTDSHPVCNKVTVTHTDHLLYQLNATVSPTTDSSSSIGGSRRTPVPLELQQKLPELLCVDEFQEIHLCVMGIGAAPLTCAWMYNDKPIESQTWDCEVSEASDGTFCLVIDKAKPRYSGEFSAVLTNPQGQCVSKCSVTVHDAKPAVKRHFPVQLCLREGQSDPVEVTCQVNAASNLRVRARKDARLVSLDQTRFGLVLDETTGSCKLSLKNPRQTDSGKYEFVFSNKSGVASSLINIQVMAPLRKPKLSQPLEQLEPLKLLFGESMSLKCEVHGDELTSGEWTKDERPVSSCEAASEGRLRISREEVSASCCRFNLTVDRVMPTDTGCYALTVANSAGSVTSRCRVDVQKKAATPPPADPQPKTLEFETELSDCIVNEGDKDMQLACSLKRPDSQSKATWFFNKELIRHEQQKQEFDGKTARLVFPVLTPDNTGVYICGIKNSFSQVVCNCYLTVKPKVLVPVIAKPLEAVKVKEGGDIVLQAELESIDRSCKIRWYQNDQDLCRVSGLQMEFNGKVARLVIRDAYENDAGQYKLVVTNEAGIDRSECFVVVDEKPISAPRMMKPLQSCAKKLGDPVTLSCELDCAPSRGCRVDWYFQDALIEIDSSHCDITCHDAILSLTIANCTEQDAGQYSVRVANKTGEASSDCHLEVEVPKLVRTMSDGSIEVNIAECTDLDFLGKLMSKTEDFERRKLIRSRQKELYDMEAKLIEEKKKSHVMVDPVAARARMAEEAKARKLQGFQEMAKQSPGALASEDAVKMRAERQQKERELEMQTYSELAKIPGVGQLQGGSERVHQLEQAAAEQAKARQLKQFDDMAKHVDKPGTIVVNEGASHAPASAMSKFKALAEKSSSAAAADAAANPAAKRPPGAVLKRSQSDASVMQDATPKPAAAVQVKGGRGLKRTQSAATIKQCLQDWCKAVTSPYRQWGVEVTNLSSSWADGLAFCALIHSFYPEAFKFEELSAANRRRNFELAFETAEKYAGISKILDVDDMVSMATPDWKCIFTYLQLFYRKFRNFNANSSAAAGSIAE